MLGKLDGCVGARLQASLVNGITRSLPASPYSFLGTWADGGAELPSSGSISCRTVA